MKNSLNMHFLIWKWHKNVILQGNTLCYADSLCWNCIVIIYVSQVTTAASYKGAAESIPYPLLLYSQDPCISNAL